MRPVNLIPPEQRRGERGPGRTGAAPYLIVAALVVALGFVVMLVQTNNTISEREAEKASLEAQKAAAEEQVRELAPYAEFASVQELRRQTVSSLAESRFDWQRVLRELAIVLPSDVWLVEMSGSVVPEVAIDSSGVAARDTIAAPALELVGCGADQDAVARFVAALEDIDGVTRVGVQESQRPALSSSGGAETGGAETGSSGDDCRTRDHIARFEIVVAFDAVTAPEAAATTPEEPSTTEPAPEAETPDTADPAQASSTDDSGTEAVG